MQNLNLDSIQKAIRDQQFDGWLFFDFRGSDPLAASILGLSKEGVRSRRWFYFVPADGEPTKLVHAIEQGALDVLPGSKKLYLAWQELRDRLGEMLAGQKQVAMQYSPNNAIPYVSRVDAGTVELVRSFGVTVVSSADLVARFEATIDDAGRRSHDVAAEKIAHLKDQAFAEIGRRLAAGTATTEWDIQQYLWQAFAAEGLTADHAPIVAVNANSADPHYAPQPGSSAPTRVGDFVLLDLWAKLDQPGSIYADITWVAHIGKEPSPEHVRIFNIVRDARDAAVAAVQSALKAGQPIRGCDVDDVCRSVIVKHGFGQQFIHRTGHSIHEMTHGNGANIDNLETRDERRLIPRTLFSIEPGIYLPGNFGIRSEIDVFIEDTNTAVVTGPPAQRQIVCIGPTGPVV